MKIAFVYFSASDITEQLVMAASDAIQSEGGQCLLYAVRGENIKDGRFVDHSIFESLSECRAIIFASPTYMGGVAAQFKAFVDASSELWCEQAWANKFAAGITCGGALNGDQSSTLQYMATYASQQGMIWVNLDSAHGFNDHGINRLGCQWGVVAQTKDNIPHKTDLATAAYLGERVLALCKNSVA